MNLDLTILAALWPILRDVLAFIWGALPIPVTDLLMWQFIYLPLLLAVAYPIVIQYERKGLWRVVLFVPTLAAALVDVYLNFTTFALYLWSAPGKKEYTFSEHLERLVWDTGWRGVVARLIARYTNKFDPTPPHIPLP